MPWSSSTAATNVNATNDAAHVSLIDRIISAITSFVSGAGSEVSVVDARENITEVKVELIRSFSDKAEFEKYIGKPANKQVVILSESPRKIMSDKEIKFHDSKGDLMSTYSCERCELSQSPNRRYTGVLEQNKDFSQLNFTLMDEFGQVLWYKENFHPTIEGSVGQVYVSNDGKNVISATMRKKTVPYSILFHDSKGNLITEYQEYKDAEKFDFHMAVSELSPDGNYFVVAGPDGIFAFGWDGELIWKYEFSPIYMSVVHEILISPDGDYIVVKVDEHPAEEEMNVCLYFLDRTGKFIGRYSKEYLHGWSKFSEDGKSLLIANHTRLFLFDSGNAKKLWSYQFDKECVYIPSLTTTHDGKWIVLVRAVSETDKAIYLFSNTGEMMWTDKFEGDDLGDLTQPVVEFVGDGSTLSVKFPDKILLFDVINEGS